MLNIVGLGSIGTSLYAIYHYQVFIASQRLLPPTILCGILTPNTGPCPILFNANYYGLFCIFLPFLVGASNSLSGQALRRPRSGMVFSMVLNVVGILLTASHGLAGPGRGTITFVFFINRRLVLWLGLPVALSSSWNSGASHLGFFSHSLEERK